MSLRLFVAPAPGTLLAAGAEISLPEEAARHAQVRRVQPGDALTLFDGAGQDWAAEVLAMGRRDVRVRVGAAQPVARELPSAVTLALGVPANERMDALVEKATELGVAAIQPLMTERAVLRLEGERALKRCAHWQAVAVAASEQCGRARVPEIAPVCSLAAYLAASRASAGAVRVVLSTAADAPPLASLLNPAATAAPGDTPPLPALTLLSGPEGGLAPAEMAAALAAGFAAASLGPRILRADTAPLAALAWWALR